MAGVRQDFEKVYEENFSYIYNFIYGQLLHREKSEDLVSEIFIKAMSHYDGYDPARASVRTWLVNIARNTLIDEYRRLGKRDVSSLDAEDAVEPSYEDEYAVLHDPVNREVHELMQKLTPEERELLTMIYFEDMKNPEIGKVLGIQPKAVSERHRRLLAKCRRLEGDKDFKELFE